MTTPIFKEEQPLVEVRSDVLVKDSVTPEQFKAFFENLDAQQKHALSYRQGANTEKEIPFDTPTGEVYPFITWGRLLDFCQANSLVYIFTTYFTVRKVIRFVAD